MIVFDKLLAEMTDKRYMLNNNVNRLSAENPKLYKKISHLFDDITYWMESAEFYMIEIKQSIENRKASSENNAYKNLELSEKQVKKDNPIYPFDERIKVGCNIKDNPYV